MDTHNCCKEYKYLTCHKIFYSKFYKNCSENRHSKIYTSPSFKQNFYF